MPPFLLRHLAAGLPAICLTATATAAPPELVLEPGTATAADPALGLLPFYPGAHAILVHRGQHAGALQLLRDRPDVFAQAMRFLRDGSTQGLPVEVQRAPVTFALPGADTAGRTLGRLAAVGGARAVSACAGSSRAKKGLARGPADHTCPIDMAGMPQSSRKNHSKSLMEKALENKTESAESPERAGGSPVARVSVAPMMDWTDRHCRFFLRQFSPHTLLYTEMINAQAILRGDAQRLLRHCPEEHPLAIQLGGSDPAHLAAAARIAEDAGYIEVNLNCGCPSDRVAAGAFGACLMARPALVAECVAAMKQAVRVPVTVKYRVGVVDRDASGAMPAKQAALGFDQADQTALGEFTRAIIEAGADRLIVHARKAVLGGLSPHENRTVPPLRYDLVAGLHRDFPQLPMVLNGGLRLCGEVLQALATFDGVMIGREAYHRPELLGELHAALYPHEPPPPTVHEVLAAMREYALRETAAGTQLAAITRHLLGLMSGRPGARALRQVLSQDVRQGIEVTEVFARAQALAQAA